MSDIQSNSFRSRTEPEPQTPPKMTKVAETKATVKKKGFFERVAETFIPEDIPATKKYIVDRVIKPEIKKTILDVINIWLFKDGGEYLGSSTGSVTGNIIRRIGRDVDYAAKSHLSSVNRGAPSLARPKIEDNMDEICTLIFETRRDAETVLDEIGYHLNKYHRLTIGDLYDAAGLPTKYTYYDWGWNDISTAVIRPCGEGVLLRMPRPVLLGG